MTQIYNTKSGIFIQYEKFQHEILCLSNFCLSEGKIYLTVEEDGKFINFDKNKVKVSVTVPVVKLKRLSYNTILLHTQGIEKLNSETIDNGNGKRNLLKTYIRNTLFMRAINF